MVSVTTQRCAEWLWGNEGGKPSCALGANAGKYGKCMLITNLKSQQNGWDVSGFVKTRRTQ